MRVNRPDEPAYTGGLTFRKVPLALEPEQMAGADVVIVGAPMDDMVTNRPGTRFGPREIRIAYEGGGEPQGWHMDLGVDPFAELKVVDRWRRVGDAGRRRDESSCDPVGRVRGRGGRSGSHRSRRRPFDRVPRHRPGGRGLTARLACGGAVRYPHGHRHAELGRGMGPRYAVPPSRRSGRHPRPPARAGRHPRLLAGARRVRLGARQGRALAPDGRGHRARGSMR